MLSLDCLDEHAPAEMQAAGMLWERTDPMRDRSTAGRAVEQAQLLSRQLTVNSSVAISP